MPFTNKKLITLAFNELMWSKDSYFNNKCFPSIWDVGPYPETIVQPSKGTGSFFLTHFILKPTKS